MIVYKSMISSSLVQRQRPFSKPVTRKYILAIGGLAIVAMACLILVTG